MPGTRFPLLSAFIVLVTLSASGCSALAVFNAVAPRDSGSVQVAEGVAYRQGPRGMLDIYAPRVGDGSLPVVFFIYGGSWNSGSREDYAFAGRAVAARGYVTVVADYRLVPDVRYPTFLRDNADALAWTHGNIARYGGDPERLFVVGHSAGAYNAVMLALDPALLADAGAERGMIDGVAALSGPYDFLPLDDETTIAAFASAGDPAATQPIELPAAGAPPMLLLHGATDTLVMPRNTRALADHLAEAGVPVETHIYPDVDHADTLLALSRTFRDTAPILEEIDAFFSDLAN